MKKLFSQDVRSRFDVLEERVRDESMDRSSYGASIKSKKSVEVGHGGSFDFLESLPEREEKKSNLKIKAVESLNPNALRKIRQEFSSEDLFVENKKSEIEKSENE